MKTSFLMIILISLSTYSCEYCPKKVIEHQVIAKIDSIFPYVSYIDTRRKIVIADFIPTYEQSYNPISNSWFTKYEVSHHTEIQGDVIYFNDYGCMVSYKTPSGKEMKGVITTGILKWKGGDSMQLGDKFPFIILENINYCNLETTFSTEDFPHHRVEKPIK